jgi:ribosomal-protein-alanine N-acetyltransferase
MPGSSFIRLERPTLRRQAEYIAAVKRSAKLHRGFVTCAATPAEYRDYLRQARRANRESFFVVAPSGELAGAVSLSEIVHYAFQSAYLGYYAFAPHSGKGFMRAGIELVLAEAFGKLGLHRVEANIQPANERSIALVRGLGFRYEGLARRYLKIGGRWRDHEHWALTIEDWRASRHRRPSQRRA